MRLVLLNVKHSAPFVMMHSFMLHSSLLLVHEISPHCSCPIASVLCGKPKGLKHAAGYCSCHFFREVRLVGRFFLQIHLHPSDMLAELPRRNLILKHFIDLGRGSAGDLWKNEVSHDARNCTRHSKAGELSAICVAEVKERCKRTSIQP